MRIIVFVIGVVVLLSSNVLVDGPMAEDVVVHGDRAFAAFGIFVLAMWGHKLKPANNSRRFRDKTVIVVKIPR